MKCQHMKLIFKLKAVCKMILLQLKYQFQLNVNMKKKISFLIFHKNRPCNLGTNILLFLDVM
jgi:hypothetical protein